MIITMENKFMHYKTYAQFKKDKDAGLIPSDSIVFVKDVYKIYTHDSEYGGEANSTPIDADTLNKLLT